jgi:hypothetical protein
MRLVSLSFGIVIGFVLGVWGISQLLPEGSPEWLGVTLSVTWLFLLILGAVLISSKSGKKVYDQRRLFGYGLLAAILMASFLVPLLAFKIDVPKWVARAVCSAIGVAVFLLSKYMERRKSQRTLT